jgi:hypothetical protein
MQINYDNPQTLSVSKMYEGSTEDGRKFMVIASWNDWDDWTVDSINWDDGNEGTNEEEVEIIELFTATMNS